MNPAAFFDGSSDKVWDKLSDNPFRDSAYSNQAPDFNDWDRAAAELIAVQAYLAQLPNLGVVATATGLSLTEDNGAQVHQTTINLDGVVLTANHDDVTHGNYTSQELYDFAAGNILILGATANLAIQRGAGSLTDTAALVVGVGTQAAAASASDGTLAAGEASIIPSTAYTLSGGAKTSTPAYSTGVKSTGTKASPAKAYLNVQCPTAGSAGTDTLTFTGTVTLTWVQISA